MKKILFTSALLLGITMVNGQNWEPFKANETYNFNIDPIHGLRVDSVIIQGNDTVFHFNRTLNDTVLANTNFSVQFPIQNITKANIFGDRVKKRNDSIIFSNNFGDILYLKPSASINQSWDFVQLGSDRIQATIDSIYIDTLNQTIDSIKRIAFQYFNSSNNAVNHSINSQRIFLSKSNGFVKTFSLYHENIGQSVNYSFYRYKQIFKSTTFTNAEVFDLNIGDEYHFNYDNRPPGSPPGHDIRNHIVTGKTISANGDTIRLQILEHREKQTSVVDYTTNPPTLIYTTNNWTRNLTRTILFPNDTFNSNVGLEVNISHDSSSYYDSVATTTGYSFYLPHYNTYTYNNRITIQPEHQIFNYDSILNSWIIDYYAQNSYTRHYLVGICYFSNYWNNQGGGGGYPEYYSMLYFKKGTETWGTPRLVNGIEEPLSINNQVYLYPNPSNKLIQLETNGNSFNEIQIFTMHGRMARRQTFEDQIDISELKNGLYLLKLIGKNQIIERKFVKQ